MGICTYQERIERCEAFRFTGNAETDFVELSDWLKRKTDIVQGCGMNYSDGGFIHWRSGEFLPFRSRDILTIEDGRVIVNSPEEFDRKWERTDKPWR